MMKKSLFEHLTPFQKHSVEEIVRDEEVWKIESSVVKFALHYLEGQLEGSKACSEMLRAFYNATENYRSEDGMFHMREYLNYLNSQIGFIVKCRSINTGMKNAIRTLKVYISRLKSGIDIEQGKKNVIEIINNYLEDKVININ